MTVATTTITAGPFTGNGITTQFSTGFRVDNDTDITVYETTDAGVLSTLVLDTDYSIADLGEDAGATLTRIAGALPTDYTWYIRSNRSPVQSTDFDSQGSFSPVVHENAFDYLTFLIQQVSDQIDRCIKMPDSYSGAFDPELPDPEDGKYMQWNGNEIIMVAGTVSVSASEVRTLVDAATDSNVFTDADHSKLDGIEASATADQSDAEIETAYNNQVGAMSQATAEAGTSTTVERVTAQRLQQAAAAEAREEGGWTPVLEDTSDNAVAGTFSGRYIRDGNWVTARFTAVASSIAGVSGVIRFSGLPFNVSGDGGGGYVTYANNVSLGTAGAITLDCPDTLDNANLYVHNDAAGPTGLDATELTASGEIEGIIIYYTED